MNTSHSGTNGPVSHSLPAPRPDFTRRWRSSTILTAITVVTMVVGWLAFVPMGAAADAGAGTSTVTETTDELNLRAAPALNAEIITVLRPGATVEITGAAENGFYPVVSAGQAGFAYGYYLSGVTASDDSVTPGGQAGETNVVAGPVNFRTGPSTSDAVISVIPDGALVALTGDSANGFVSLTYTDRTGWADAASVLGSSAPAPVEPPVTEETPVTEEPDPPDESEDADIVPVGEIVTGNATVVDGNLNLRTGPGTSYAVVTVIPDGVAVELRGEGQNGFLPVSFEGTTGWAAADFLAEDGEEPAPPVSEDEEAVPTEAPATEPPVAEEPVPTEAPEEPVAPPVDGSDGYTEDEIVGIIYAAADQYGQPREDMLRVARCESVLDPSAVNASSNASGLFQFLPSTWATTPYADQDIFDPVANANAAGWMWANGRRNEWVCQ